MDIARFYDEDERRRNSTEITFGDGWTSAADPHATFRLQFIVTTGELAAVREPHPGGLLARYLDAAHLDQAQVDELVVRVLGRFPDHAAVDRALAGWPHQMVGPDSLAWVRERCRQP